MKYYIITVDPNYVPPSPTGWYGHLDRRTVSTGKIRNISRFSLFPVERHMQMVFTDVITFPCFMVSGMVRDVIKKYDSFIRFSRVIFYDRERMQSMAYYIPLLEQSDRLQKEKAGEPIAEQSEIKNRVMMELTDHIKFYVIMRLDLLESILRRDAVGIGAREIQIREGRTADAVYRRRDPEK